MRRCGGCGARRNSGAAILVPPQPLEQVLAPRARAQLESGGEPRVVVGSDAGQRVVGEDGEGPYIAGGAIIPAGVRGGMGRRG